MIVDQKALRSEFDPILLQYVYEILAPFVAKCGATGNVDGLKRLLDRQLIAYATPQALSTGADALEIRFFCDIAVERHGRYDHTNDCLNNNWWSNVLQRRESYLRVKDKMLALMNQYVIDALTEGALAVGSAHFNDTCIEVSFEKHRAGELMYLPRILVPVAIFDPKLPAVTRVESVRMLLAILKRFHNAEMRARFLNAVDGQDATRRNYGISQDADALAAIALARYSLPMFGVSFTKELHFNGLGTAAPMHTCDFFIQK